MNKILRQVKAFAIFAPLFICVLSGNVAISLCGVVYAVILATNDKFKKFCDVLLKDAEELFS